MSEKLPIQLHYTIILYICHYLKHKQMLIQIIDFMIFNILILFLSVKKYPLLILY